MAPNKAALRNKAEQTAAEVDRLRSEFKKSPADKALGRRLFNARQKASDALVALYEAFPAERPPTREVEL